MNLMNSVIGWKRHPNGVDKPRYFISCFLSLCSCVVCITFATFFGIVSSLVNLSVQFFKV